MFGITDVTNLKKKVKKQLAGDLIRHKVLPAKANQVGRVIGARLVKWKRYFAPEPLINEWKESKQDEFAFQFHVPPPRIVYLDHTEVRCGSCAVVCGPICWFTMPFRVFPSAEVAFQQVSR